MLTQPPITYTAQQLTEIRDLGVNKTYFKSTTPSKLNLLRVLLGLPTRDEALKPNEYDNEVVQKLLVIFQNDLWAKLTIYSTCGISMVKNIWQQVQEAQQSMTTIQQVSQNISDLRDASQTEKKAKGGSLLSSSDIAFPSSDSNVNLFESGEVSQSDAGYTSGTTDYNCYTQLMEQNPLDLTGLVIINID